MTIDCDQMIQTIYLSFDGEMDAGGQESLEAHLAICSPCARRRKSTGEFLSFFRQRAVRMAAPANLKRRILQGLPHRQQALGAP